MNLPPTLYIAAALLFIVVLRRFSPIVASAIGMGLATAIGIWGIVLYSRGLGITFLTAPVPAAGFAAFVLILLALEAMNLWLAIKKRQKQRQSQSAE